MRKKILSLALALVMVLTIAPIAMAAETQTISNDTMTLTNVIRTHDEKWDLVQSDWTGGEPPRGYAIYFVTEGATVTINAPIWAVQTYSAPNYGWDEWKDSDGAWAYVAYESDSTIPVHGVEFNSYNDGYEDPQTFTLDVNTYYVFILSYHYPNLTTENYPDGITWEFNLQICVVDDETAAQIPQTTPTAPSDTPSAWAVPEVNAAIEAGLVPENLQKNYQQDVTREAIATLFINVIEQASGMSIEEFMAEKGVEINPDAYSDTNNPSILAADALGILRGVGDGKFNPDGNLLRSHIATVVGRVARTLGIDTEGYTHSFADLVGHWAESEVGWAVHMNIIRGVSDTEFNPEGNLTTEQLIAMANRTLEALSK